MAGLITAMVPFSKQRTGLPVSYVELDDKAVSICQSSSAGLLCALFHDVSDGREFGNVVSRELLQAFIQMYAGQTGKVSQHTDFDSFNSRVSEIIRGSAQPVLNSLSSHRGVEMAALMRELVVVASTADIDRVSVQGNTVGLVNAAAAVMATQHDTTQQITLRDRRTSTHVVRLLDSTLIVVVKNGVKNGVLRKAIDDCAALLTKILSMASNLQDSWQGP